MENLFDAAYKWVFISTAQIVAPREVIDDPEICKSMMDFFGNFEKNISPTFLMFPWLPTPTAIKRLYSGFMAFMKVKKIVENRKQSETKGGDALDFMIAQGDSDMNMIQVSLILL
jgi:hypothetical protein